MRIRRQRAWSPIPTPVKILLSLVLIVGMSFSLAWVWHTTQQSVAAEAAENAGDAAEAEATQDTASGQQPALETAAAPQAAPATSAPSPEPASEGSEADGDEESEAPAEMEGAVPQSEPVSQSYFDDAIFFGDSISTGIPLYHIADNAAVVAMTGINTDNINYKQAIDPGDGNRVTFIEAAKLHGPRSKVYILLGGNGIGYDKETFISGYKQFLDSVKELYPDAIIYLQGMTPVTADYVNEFDPELDNDKIDDYNIEIMELARREKVYYLDIGSALKDETGTLPKEASPLDGMHFSPEYYHKWFDYLKTHTVEAKK